MRYLISQWLFNNEIDRLVKVNRRVMKRSIGLTASELMKGNEPGLFADDIVFVVDTERKLKRLLSLSGKD